MLIVLALYFGLIWVVFSKLKVLPWNGFWKGVVYTGALVIALVVIGALNHTAPSGPVSVQGVVTNIAPNVAGPVTTVEVRPNQTVARGDVLFRIDDTTQRAEVARLEATVLSAQTEADRLLTDLAAAEADVQSLQAQLEFGQQRRDDIVRLEERGASTGFQMQEAVSTIDQLTAGMRAAEARKAGLERRIAAQVDGVDVAVIEAQEALVQARWTLEQTVVRAPDDGVITGLSLRPGNRASPLQGAINFVAPADRFLIANLPQSSLTNVAVGDTIRVALGTLPGSDFKTTIAAIPPGTAEGALDLRAGLPTIRELGGIGSYALMLDLPDSVPTEALRLGTSGTALVITEEAGAIAVLAEILFWIGKMLNYL